MGNSMANQKSAMSFFVSSSRGGRKIRGPYQQYTDNELKEKMIEVRQLVNNGKGNTPMEWRSSNPKQASSDAYYRYSLFMNAKTIEQYAVAQLQVDEERKAKKHQIESNFFGDIKDGLQRGFVKIG